MNVLDTELAQGALARAGFQITPREEEASVVVLNTCSVRQLAEDKVWGRLGRLRVRKDGEPGLVVAVVGCMPERDGQELLARAPHVDLICGPDQADRLPELLVAALGGEKVVATGASGEVQFQRDVTCRPVRHSALVSVIRGCSLSCTYCIVPRVRGPEVSRPIPEVVAEVRSLAADGCREVTLLGQNIDAYGRTPRHGSALPELLQALHEIERIQRIRFVTSHPRDITQRLVDVMADLPRVARFLHMPAQSGSDAVLRRMRRGYTADRYRRIVAQARQRIPDLEFLSDFIVGFPGETEEDFAATERLLREVECQTAYIFKYSIRPGTAAASLPDDVPLEVKKERNARLLAAQEEVATVRQQAQVGQRIPVLVEGPSRLDPTRQTGRGPGNHIVVFRHQENLAGELVNVTITSATPLTLHGEVHGRA